MIDVSVCIIVFNRLDLALELMGALQRAMPSRLYIVSDGPRKSRIGEAEIVASVRNAVEAAVNWPCDIYKNYSDENMGCDARIVSGLNWLFIKTEAAIILEDDCIPAPSFIEFCASMLKYYSKDDRIMHISGCNFDDRVKQGDYYFSQYVFTWGWATWARAWQFFDYRIEAWANQEVVNNIKLQRRLTGDFKYWSNAFDSIIQKKGDWWDYKWVLACWVNGGSGITPRVNLISNKGFGVNATHTTHDDTNISNRVLGELLGPYEHPTYRLIPSISDYHFAKKYCRLPSFSSRIIRKLKRILKL